MSATLQRALDAGELDLALLKREAGQPGAIATWPERLQWVTSREHPVDLDQDPVPLAVAEQGCLYRNQLIHALDAAGRAWHVAYTSPNLHGIQAAVSAGLGVSILSDMGDSAGAPHHRHARLPADHKNRAGARCEPTMPARRSGDWPICW